MATLTLHDRTATGKPVSTFELPNVPERITLRELIRLRVREEVAAYNLRPSSLFKGLVQPEDAVAEGIEFRLRAPRRLDWEKQADAAIESFGRNGFFVMVNKRQVLDLDAEIELSDTLDVGFIKLRQLVGG
jgi:hypothetical protein